MVVWRSVQSASSDFVLWLSDGRVALRVLRGADDIISFRSPHLYSLSIALGGEEEIREWGSLVGHIQRGIVRFKLTGKCGNTAKLI